MGLEVSMGDPVLMKGQLGVGGQRRSRENLAYVSRFGLRRRGMPTPRLEAAPR
jgi:hypothetical protein